MAVHEIMTNQTQNGIGTSMTNGNDLSIYAITLSGKPDGAFIDIIVDLTGGSDPHNYVVVGKLSCDNPSRLIMLPAGAKVNTWLHGATPLTNITVRIA